MDTASPNELSRGSGIAMPRRWTLWFAVGTMIVLYVVLYWLNRPLVNAVAPRGIISFELAHTRDTSSAMLASWDEAARSSARANLIIDYCFMLAYGSALALGCLSTRARTASRWPLVAQMARILAAGTVGAAVLDAVENAALLLQLTDGASVALALLAWGCASAKFTLVLLAIPFALPALWPTRRPA